jgi:TRAP transporter TAXI family solute receptor
VAAWRLLVMLGLLPVLSLGCRAAPPPPTPVHLVIGTVFSGGTWDLVGRALAAAYNERLPNVHAVATPINDLWRQMDALEQGASDLAIDDVETAYIAYSTGTQGNPHPHTRLRAIAVLFSTAVQIVVHGDSGITRLTDLRGKRVGVGSKGSATERAARLILQSHGVSYEEIHPVMTPGNAAAFRAGRIDALFIYAPFQNPLIAEMSGAGNVRLIPIERDALAAIQEEHHFLKSTTIPGGTYRNQEEDVLTVGMDVLLLCRQDLSEGLAYDLSRTLFESVPQLRLAHASASGIDPDRGPTAAIPLHPGAARYYREREILK